MCACAVLCVPAAGAQVGGAARALAALEKALGGASHAPCLTIVESQGEDPMYNSSISCFAAVSDHGNASDPISSRHRATATVGTADVTTTVVTQKDGTLWLAAAANPSASAANQAVANPAASAAFWAAIASALKAASGGTVEISDAVDCTVLVPHTTSEAAVAKIQGAARTATTDASAGVHVAAQLTVVKTGLGSSPVKLRCTALVGGGPGKRLHVAPQAGGSEGAAPVSTVVAGGFAYVSGVGSVNRNGTDAFKEISKSLKAAGSRMNLVLNCLFWVTSERVIDPFFGGFQQAFNVEAFPPPSRTEFVGSSPRSQCLGGAACPVLSKCVAAMPASQQ